MIFFDFFSCVFFKITVSFFVILIFFSSSHGITTTEVFEWWDDGLIESADVTDFLEMIETGSDEEAEERAYALGLIEKPKKAKGKQQKKVEGNVSFKISLDSVGSIENHREQWTLKYAPWIYKGDNFGYGLLGYQKEEYKAFFGELNHSTIGFPLPLNSYVGSFASYEDLFFSLGGFLFTNNFWGVMAGAYGFRIWFLDYKEEFSYLLELQQKNFSLAWLSFKENSKGIFRLKVDFQGGGNNQWKYHGLFFYHENDLSCDFLKLTSSIKKSRLWSSQSQSYEAGDFLISAEERVVIPLDSGNVFSQVGMAVSKNKGVLRIKVKGVYKSYENESETWISNLESSLVFQNVIWFFKSKYSWLGTFHVPQINAGLKVETNNKSYFKVEYVVPEWGASRKKPYLLRNESGIKLDYFSLGVRFTWQRFPSEGFIPKRFGIESKIFF